MNLPLMTYGSGHANLDRDHEILFEILNRLKSGMDAAPQRREAIGAELLAYLDAHCEHEEQLMERHQFPGLAGHRRAHQKFRADAEANLRTCAAPNAPLEPLVVAIENWFENHIREADARFAEFLSSRNVEPGLADAGIFSDGPVDPIATS